MIAKREDQMVPEQNYREYLDRILPKDCFYCYNQYDESDPNQIDDIEYELQEIDRLIEDNL